MTLYLSDLPFRLTKIILLAPELFNHSAIGNRKNKNMDLLCKSFFKKDHVFLNAEHYTYVPKDMTDVCIYILIKEGSL